MGGERFDTPQPESYLFGENSDLNFLGSRPTPVSQTFMILFLLSIKILVLELSIYHFLFGLCNKSFS